MIVNFLFDNFIESTGEPWWNMPDIPRYKVEGDIRLMPYLYGWWGVNIVNTLTVDNPLQSHENEIRIVRTLDHELKSEEINIYPIFVSDKVVEAPNVLLWIPRYVVDQVNAGLLHLVITNYFEGDFVDHNRMKFYYKFYLSTAGIKNFSKVSIVGNCYFGEKKINALRTDENDIKYVNCHTWEKYHLQYLHQYSVDTSRYVNENKSKIFLMQIRSPRTWRYFTYKYLEYFKALDKGLYSYVIDIDATIKDPKPAIDCFDNHKHDRFFTSHFTFEEELYRTNDSAFINWLNIHDTINSKRLPNCQLDNRDVEKSAAYVDESWIRETYFSVVCEAQMANTNGMITEKTFRTIYYGHPFIILGSPGILAELRSLGYHTFPELFDESYDDMPCSINKIKFIAEQVSKWCDESRRDELNQIMKDIYPKIVHNRNTYISKDHSKFWNNFK